VTRILRWMLVGGVLLVTAPRSFLPLPPPLPFDPPTDRAAPVPNDTVTAPDSTPPAESTFALTIYPMREYNTGEGFIPGSAYQSPEERKPLQPPGFLVTIPLR